MNFPNTWKQKKSDFGIIAIVLQISPCPSETELLIHFFANDSEYLSILPLVVFAWDGQKEQIGLGKCGKRNGETIKQHIETLLECRTHGAPIPSAESVWLSGCDESFKEKLADAGIIDYSPAAPLAQLGSFLAEYRDTRRKTHKPATIVVWENVIRNLVGYFGTDKPLEGISHADAEGFYRHLLESGLSETTVQKRIQHARMFFSHAKRLKMISENPFEYIKAKRGDVSERRAYVSAETIHRVIAAATSPQWKLLIALARFAGLRTPSEPLSLRWHDINFDTGRMIITSPKTEHHVGGGKRVVPIFPSFRAYLEEHI